MALSGSQKAYLYARSGIARSGATRSNYVQPWTTVEWIRRDSAGNVIASADLTDVILQGSLHVTQALNDEPDTCSFELRPQEPPAMTPACGDEIRISWTTGGGATLFHGFIIVVQQDWRLGNLQPPWLAVQCQDAMFRFDARFVTYRFPAQSVTASIADLVRYFCNLSPTTPHPLDFQTTAVQAAMPSLPSFDVVNQRPSTVMRTLTAAVGGGFYVDGLSVHAWAGSASEPNQQNPVPLTVDLKTLKAFRLTTDATQLRRRVLVEGQRASTLIPHQTVPAATSIALGVAISDASTFAGADRIARIGSQWMLMGNIASVMASGANPPQTQTNAAFTAGGLNQMSLKQIATLPPPYGWVRIGNQYARYGEYLDNPLTGVWRLVLAGPPFPYGVFTGTVPANETVEWVDGAANTSTRGLNWRTGVNPGGNDETRAQPVNTEVVTLAMQQAPVSSWPELESLVQDGRYSYAGAQARADADLEAFQDPLVSVEWVTEDLAALPGRSQVIALDSPAVTPAINLTVTILHVDITFPLRTLPPRRACTGGVVKPSTFLDLVVTTSD